MSAMGSVDGRLAVVEAALYAAGRPVGIGALKRVAGTQSDRVVTRLLRELGRRYEARGGSLEVRELPEGMVVLRPRTEFLRIVKRLSRRPLLTGGPLKILSYIAYYQPVEQSKVVSDLGVHVYSNLKLMEEIGLIEREKTANRGVAVRTTPYFADYFGFSGDLQKSKLQLRQVFAEMKITKLDNGNGENHAEGRPKGPTDAEPPILEALADAGDGLPEGLPEYPRPADESSQ